MLVWSYFYQISGKCRDFLSRNPEGFCLTGAYVKTLENFGIVITGGSG